MINGNITLILESMTVLIGLLRKYSFYLRSAVASEELISIVFISEHVKDVYFMQKSRYWLS